MRPETRNGKNYVDEESAIAVHGTIEKKDLESTPWSVEFAFGANYDGYWTYDHLACQIEDLTDVVQVMFPWVQLHVLVDHSSGHDKTRPDGLNPNNMNKEFGGKHKAMHSTLIKEEAGYLGPFPRLVTDKSGEALSFEKMTKVPTICLHTREPRSSLTSGRQEKRRRGIYSKMRLFHFSK